MSADPYRLLRAGEVMLGDWLRVRRGEDVLITADTETDPAVVRASFAAAERLGARPTVSTAARLPFQGLLADPYIPKVQAEAVKLCDVWVDLTFPYFAGSTAHDHAMKSGRVRYMLGGDMDAGALDRLFGRVDLDAYFEAQAAFDALFVPGRQCRITTPLGTDFSLTVGKRGIAKPRHADRPGMYILPGMASIPAETETIKGKVVVTHAFHEYYARLPSPVTLQVDGKIRAVTGGGEARAPLERALRRAGGGNYGSIIHLTHGLHPAARLTGRRFIEDIRAFGVNAVGLGIPFWLPGGGENHPDAVLSEQSIWLDGERIIADGHVVPGSALAAKVEALVPINP